jgi:hypothetical protein
MRRRQRGWRLLDKVVMTKAEEDNDDVEHKNWLVQCTNGGQDRRFSCLVKLKT